MKVIRELYDTITEVLGYDEKKWNGFKVSLNTSLKRQFFELYRNGYSEKEIAYELFRSETAIAPYRNTKHALKEALQSEIFKFQAPQYHYNPFQRAYYKAIQQQAVFKVLVGLGRNHSVLHIGEHLLKKAMTYDLTDVVVDVTKQLCKFHSTKAPNCKIADLYFNLHKKYTAIYEKETKAELAWARIASRVKDEDAPSQTAALKIATDYLSENIAPDENIESYKFYLFHYSIIIFTHELRKDYYSVEKIALRAYDHFCSLPYNHKIAKEIFTGKAIYAQLQLNDLQASFRSIDLATELTRKGTPNWFITLELKVRASLIAGKYDQAQTTYQTMIDHRNFEHQPLNKRIRWILIGSYLQFLRVIDLASGRKPTTQFINKHFNFLSKHQNHAELKELKVPYIIAQLLFSIYDRDYDSMESRIYSLKDFCNTYLKKSTPNYRSSCFIKMLLLVPLNNFHPKVVERRVGHYLKKLKVEAFIIDHSRIVEIIPYEKLWTIILDYLERPKRQRKSEYAVEDWSLGKRKLL